jgi:ornithine cyclodeaminase/alanine dehydrogenase-like protein (mu-crystallin family)
MAPHLIMAHCAIRPTIERVAIWNRSPERARRVAETLGLDGIEIRATEDLEAAARQADVISCATMATEPLIRGTWLKPGAHLDLVGGYRPEMRESDDDCVRRARVYVDSRWFTLGRVGDIKTPIDNGTMTEADIAGDLFQLSRGEVPGRLNDDEITLYKNAGGGHLDLGTAKFLLSRATSS